MSDGMSDDYSLGFRQKQDEWRITCLLSAETIARVNRRLRIFAYRAYRRYQIDAAELRQRLESAK